MTDREKLEWAAKAVGIQLNFSGCNSWIAEEFGQSVKFWNPLTDQADSDVMACALDIDTNLLSGRAYARHYYKSELIECDEIERRVNHDNTLEDKCRAVREARLLVAVEIGRLK